MKATSFETRQRAEELTREAISIWRQSEREDKLGGIENDPVFNLLLTALAHQANQLDADIERLKNEVYEEISSKLIPYRICGAVPATAAVSLMPEGSSKIVRVDTDTTFTLTDSTFSFLPLLKSRAYNVEIGAPVRLDGRRWQVGLSFPGPVENLDGWTFALGGKSFRDLSLSLDGKVLDIIKPWELSELPFTEAFSLDSQLYSHSPLYENSMLCLELFARQDIRLFCLRDVPLAKATSEVTLTFEFVGVDSEFTLSRADLIPNANILVNAQVGSVDLDDDHPVARIGEEKALIHLLRPSNDQIFAGKRVDVRRAGADRFNGSSLLDLLKCLIGKFDSDAYAFRSFSGKDIDESVSKLRMLTARLQQQMEKEGVPDIKGTYILLKRDEHGEYCSLNLHFLTTDADNCNAALKQTATFSSPLLLPARQIALPVPGMSPYKNPETMLELARYQITVNDRIVTPSDVKVFCRTFLLLRYGIAGEMIRSIRVCPRPDGNSPTGYAVFTEITLAQNPFITRSFSGKRETVAMMMEKMLTVRSSGIYPIRLTINIA